MVSQKGKVQFVIHAEVGFSLIFSIDTRPKAGNSRQAGFREPPVGNLPVCLYKHVFLNAERNENFVSVPFRLSNVFFFLLVFYIPRTRNGFLRRMYRQLSISIHVINKSCLCICLNLRFFSFLSFSSKARILLRISIQFCFLIEIYPNSIKNLNIYHEQRCYCNSLDRQLRMDAILIQVILMQVQVNINSIIHSSIAYCGMLNT